MKHNLPLLSILVLSWVLLGTPVPLSAQSFAAYPAGDDVTTSLGQFQIVLDQRWVKMFDAIMSNNPLADVLATRHHTIYHRGTFTSPTLYDGTTMIGRSDAFVTGAAPDDTGALAGQAPGRTYIKDSQLTVRPTWAEITDPVHEIHTFIKSLNLTDSFTTRVGFSVKAGMQVPTRPVSAGEVEGGSVDSDFPARSFFNAFVQVALPGGGPLPAIRLVNVDPLLVEQTNLFSFPPHIVYQHGNSTAVSVYFNTDATIPDPTTGTSIQVTRGTLFGQLTLAGHGVGFKTSDIEAFQVEIENEMQSAMPINPAPNTSVHVEDFSPDYDATLPTLSAGHFTGDGSFGFTVKVTAKTTNYVQFSTSLRPGSWQTIGTYTSAATQFEFVDPAATSSPRRFYRVLGTVP